jgi:hypothetical protein
MGCDRSPCVAFEGGGAWRIVIGYIRGGEVSFRDTVETVGGRGGAWHD